MAGSTQKTIVEKLEIKEGTKIIFLNAPPHYELTIGDLPPDVDKKVNPHGAFDFIQYFALSLQELEFKFEWLRQHTRPEGILWVSWLKKSSGFMTDLTETNIKEIATEHGMVDEKIISVNDDWSAIKLIHQKGERKK